MKLADMAPAPPPRTGVPCVFDRLHPLLDDDDRATLAAWFTDPNEPPQQALWLTTPERGVTMQAPVFVAGTRKEEGW